MKNRLTYCEACTEKCKLRNCELWEMCNKACANIMSDSTRKILKRIHTFNIDELE